LIKVSCFLVAGVILAGSLNSVSAADSNQAPGQVVTDSPQLLAPGLINTGMATRDVTMSSDGKEIFFCVNTSGYNHACILTSRFKDGAWTVPEVVSFSGSPDYVDLEPALSPDGKSLFFYSTREAHPGAKDSQDLWVVNRKGDQWGEPENLGSPVNSSQSEFFPSVTNDGTIYFCRADSTTRRHNIFRSRMVEGKYQEPELLPAEVNSGMSQFNAWISQDESRLIVPVAGNPNNLGGVDYWLCERTASDTWNKPLNLGPVVNDGSGQSWSPFVSPDGQHFYFMSSRTVGPPMSWPLKWSELQGRHRQPGSGRPAIYVMKADFLDDLSKTPVNTPASGDETQGKDQSQPHFAYSGKAGRFWGQSTPDMSPELFSPGIVSSGLVERDIMLSNDGQRLLYGLMDMGLVTTMTCQWQGDHWSEPVTAPWHIDPDFACFESAFSADGNTVFFLSNQAAPGQTQGRGWANQNIFSSHFSDGSWSQPEALPEPVTTDAAEYFPSVASDGTLYFSREDDERKSAIWMATANKDGSYAEPIRLPAEINVGENNYNAFVAPDQSLIIICVGGHDENLGAADYWVSFRGNNQSWLPAVNLGPEFNGPDTRASSAFLSPDGEILFFSSSRTLSGAKNDQGANSTRLTRESLMKMHTEPGMGSSDLWWVDANILNSLRP